MSLGPHARKLLEAGRARSEPSAEERARVRSALVGRVGPAAALATIATKTAGATVAATASVSSVGATLVKFGIVGAALVGVSGGGYVVAHRAAVARRVSASHVEQGSTATLPTSVMPQEAPAIAAEAPPPAPVLPLAFAPPAAIAPSSAVTALGTPSHERTAQSRDAIVAPPSTAPAILEPVPTPTPEPQANPQPAASPPAVDTLRSELALVRAAHDALREGRPAVALERMDEHRRAYPDGALGEERDALRVSALCALGRPEAPAEARAFLEGHPTSPFLARVRDACLR